MTSRADSPFGTRRAPFGASASRRSAAGGPSIGWILASWVLLNCLQTRNANFSKLVETLIHSRVTSRHSNRCSGNKNRSESLSRCVKHGSRNVMHACTMRFWEIIERERPSVRETILKHRKHFERAAAGKSAIKRLASGDENVLQVQRNFESLYLFCLRLFRFYCRERFTPKVERIRRRRLAESKLFWISLEPSDSRWAEISVKMSSVMENQQVRWVCCLRLALIHRKPPA